ncbi:hypothetical protein [Streptomyces sp. NPDC001604]|uniref:hypothetical protein n=1 Tax=Streptomyces sp. NPDC001604 TaxID=3364593 RepID=UPI003684FB63
MPEAAQDRQGGRQGEGGDAGYQKRYVPVRAPGESGPQAGQEYKAATAAKQA